jgi:hypothetical protein
MNVKEKGKGPGALVLVMRKKVKNDEEREREMERVVMVSSDKREDVGEKTRRDERVKEMEGKDVWIVKGRYRKRLISSLQASVSP